MNELVSVIMSAYNEKSMWICESIESILNQTYNNLEYIIILDNPKNAVIEEIVQRYAVRDKRIKIIKNEKNIGLVGSLNKAIQYADGTFIARMDADDIANTNRIEIELECMRKQKVDFVMSCADYIFEDGVKQRGEDFSALNSNQIIYLLKYGHMSIHSTWLLKREIYDKLNGYRNIKYAEDVDFLIRTVQEGFQCYKMKEHTIYYRVRNEGISKTYALEQYKKAKELREFYRKKILLKEIDVQILNEKYMHLEEKEKLVYAEADEQMDKFCECFRDRKYRKSILILARGIFTNRYFREVFVRNVKYRMKLTGVKHDNH